MNSRIISCPRCGTRNRIPEDRLHQKPLCGRCGVHLPVEDSRNHPLSISDASFEREVLSDPGIVLVDFWAPWCGPCLHMAPVLDALAADYAGQIKIAKINVDENPRAASRYETRSIPTLLVFKRGELVDRLVGTVPLAEIEKHIKPLLKL